MTPNCNKFDNSKFELFMKFFILSIATLFIFSNTVFSQNDKQKAIMKYMEANQHYLKKEFVEAGDKYKAAFKLNKANKVAAFNSACSYALAKNADKAVEMAQIAYEAGMYSFDDPDFDSIRGDERFAAIEAIATADIESTKSRTMDPVVVLPSEDVEPGLGMIIAMHGYGGDPENFKQAYQAVAKKYNMILVCLRATEVTGKDAFHWNFSQSEIYRINTQIKKVIKDYKIEGDKVILTGFSQGGYLTYLVGVGNSQLFAGLIPVAGQFNASKVQFDEVLNKDLKLYSMVGKEDKPDYLKGANEAKELFEKNKMRAKVVEYNAGHTYPANSNQLISEGIDWILK